MRRGLAAAGLYVALTVALLFPLWSHFGSAFPHDAGDPILNTWILWHGTRTVPLSQAWWSGPMFFPMADAIALSELLLSLLPLSAPVQAVTGNPVVAYNAVFALSFPLCGIAAYLLARDLTDRHAPAVVGGLAFMFAPYRVEQLSHVPVLSYYWSPLILLGLHRYLRDRQWKWLCLFGVAWLAQSLTNGYAMFHVSVLVALWILWFMRPVRSWLPVLIAWAAAALPLVPLLWTYRRVHSALHLARDINEIRGFGVDLGDFMAAAPDLALWGGRLGLARPETAAFPGLTLLALGLVAIVAARAERSGTEPQRRWQQVFVLLSAVAAIVAFSAYLYGPWAIGPLTVRDFHKPFSIAVAARVTAFLGGPWMRRMWQRRSTAGFYLLATAAMLVLALGPEPRLLGRPILYEPPYAWLMRIPGFDVLRVPARFLMPAALCESVLVALAMARWSSGPRRTALVLIVTAGILVDGWFRLPVAAAPADGIHQWPANVTAVVELPLGETGADFGAIYRAMSHGKPIVNGVSGYLPPHYLPLAYALRERQFSALYELTSEGPIAVGLDRRADDAPQMLQLMRGAGFVPGPIEGNWNGMIVPVRPMHQPALGDRLGIASVSASLHEADTSRMLDGDVTTAWGTEIGQVGGEEIVVDLAAVHDVGAIVLEMGAYSFGFPRALEIDVSSDRSEWTPVWGGEPAVVTVRGALQSPDIAPIVLDLGRTSGRYLKLRQTGAEPGIPWWVAELKVYSAIK
jgi:hypothetical protein